MSMPTHRGRYSFGTYARLVLFVALFAVVNALFGNLVQNVVGNYNMVYDTVIVLGMVRYAILLALIFWIADTRGSIGRLLGAKDAEGK